MEVTAARRRFFALAAIAALGAAIAASPASGAEQGEVERGGAILDAVQAGKSSCADLDRSDFGAIGEFAMERMVGSTQPHESMDRAMATMMGSSGLESMHRYMGERFSGCARGPAPRGTAGIAGMMGMMGGGMMGGGAGRGYGPGMMGGGFDRPGDGDNDWSSAATVMAILLGVVLVLSIAAGAVYRRRGPKPVAAGPVAILDQRLAAGEISAEDYRQRRAILTHPEGEGA